MITWDLDGFSASNRLGRAACPRVHKNSLLAVSNVARSEAKAYKAFGTQRGRWPNVTVALKTGRWRRGDSRAETGAFSPPPRSSNTGGFHVKFLIKTYLTFNLLRSFGRAN